MATAESLDITAEQLTKLDMTAQAFGVLSRADQEAVLEGLTEGIYDDEEDPEAKDTKAAGAGDDPKGKAADPPAPDDAAASPQPAAEPPPAPPAAPAAAPAADAPAAPSPAPAADPDLHYYMPAAADTTTQETRIKEIDTELDTLDQKVNDGELTTAEAMKSQRTLMAERNNLATAVALESDRREQIAKAKTAAWEKAQDKFFSNPVNAELYDTDPKAFARMNAFVKQLSADPDNAGQSMGWFLDEADRLTRTMMGKTAAPPAAPAAAPAPAPGADRNQKPNRQPKLDDVPVSTSMAPAASRNNEADPFAYLDRLEGEDFTEAFEKLTPKQRDQYEVTRGV